jgi:hypothetical protein
VGFAMVALRNHIPDILSIEAGNAIALAGQSAWVAGYLALDKRRMEWWVLLPPIVWLAGILPAMGERRLPQPRCALQPCLGDRSDGAAMAVSSPGLNREAARAKLAIIFIVQSCVCFAAAGAIGLIAPG